MPGFDFDVMREKKRNNFDRSKAFRLIILFCVIAAITALVIYGRFAKLKKPLMKESCHGSCADCAINCKDRK